MRRATVVALAASCLLTFGNRGLSAGDHSDGDKLPEPALQFARETTLRLTEAEREWLKVVERLGKCQADFSVADRSYSDSSLREEAGRLLCSAKKLLADQKQMEADLDRFSDALKKASTQYREVASLYRVYAARAQASEVGEDYDSLAKAYERKAVAAAARGQQVSMPAGAGAKAGVIAEGNLFLERLVEALGIGPVSESEREVFIGRIKKQATRCETLAKELRAGVEKILRDSDAPEIRQELAGAANLKALAGAAWSSPVTIAGQRCVMVVRVNEARTYSQSMYVLERKGRASLVASVSGRFDLDARGIAQFHQAGTLVEVGQVSFLGKDQWSYEILENQLVPGIVGRRLTFTRQP